MISYDHLCAEIERWHSARVEDQSPEHGSADGVDVYDDASTPEGDASPSHVADEPFDELATGAFSVGDPEVN